jgi:DNA-binding beta-propeller fold protein YncE
MMKKTIVIALILFNTFLLAQNFFQQPESVTFDLVGNLYYVSNYNNGNSSIVTVDLEGEIQDTLATGLPYCLGIHLVDETLYASCDRNLRAYNINSKELIFDINLTNINWLDGITSDNAGFLYIIQTGGNVIKFDQLDNSFSIFAAGLPASTQDIEFDEQNDRLLVVAWSSNSSIHSIDMDSGQVNSIPNTALGRYDGITIDNDGNVYVSCHLNGGRVYRIDNSFTQPMEEIEGDFNEPAGLYYNLQNDFLIVPNFGGNNLIYIDLTSVNTYPTEIVINIISDLRNYPNPFNPSTEIRFHISSFSEIEFAKLIIYNLKGQKIKQYSINNSQSSVTWDGTNQNGFQVASGIYFARLKLGEQTATCKMLLMK